MADNRRQHGPKNYIRLNAYELGIVWASIDQGGLPPFLYKKFKRGIANVYLDSGFSREEVFGEGAVNESTRRMEQTPES